MSPQELQDIAKEIAIDRGVTYDAGLLIMLRTKIKDAFYSGNYNDLLTIPRLTQITVNFQKDSGLVKH